MDRVLCGSLSDYLAAQVIADMLSVDCKAPVSNLTYFIDAEELRIVRVVRLCLNAGVRDYLVRVYSLRGIGQCQLIRAVALFIYLA